jgi:hypothetical protein
MPKGVDYLDAPDKTAKFHRRQLIWRHNSFFGGVQFAKQNMMNILDSITATPQAKALALQIHNLLFNLGNELKIRLEEDSSHDN